MTQINNRREERSQQGAQQQSTLNQGTITIQPSQLQSTPEQEVMIVRPDKNGLYFIAKSVETTARLQISNQAKLVRLPQSAPVDKP